MKALQHVKSTNSNVCSRNKVGFLVISFASRQVSNNSLSSTKEFLSRVVIYHHHHNVLVQVTELIQIYASLFCLPSHLSHASIHTLQRKSVKSLTMFVKQFGSRSNKTATRSTHKHVYFETLTGGSPKQGELLWSLPHPYE